MAVYTPRREASGGTSPANTLISDFQPPEPGDNTFLCLSRPVWYLLWQPELIDTQGCGLY